MSMIERPQTTYDDSSHTYTLDGEELLGVSTIAKVGGVEDTWGIASAWGFRIGYEGAHAITEEHPARYATWDKADELREMLKERGLTPWSKRDKAADRGNWVHDVLEKLAQDGTLPDISGFPEEVRGHVQAVCQWYLDYRPVFVATEVQVTSTKHRFAGRYDIRCELSCWNEIQTEEPILALVDLKTSKGVYPETHFPQLAGYELAGVEMGYPATGGQFVLNTHPDGTYDFVRSWAVAEDFLAYLGALRAIRRIKDNDPKVILEKEQETWILGHLPSTSRELVGIHCPGDPDSRTIGRILSKLKKRGLVERDGSEWSRTNPPTSP